MTSHAQTIFIISGKHPIEGKGGFEVYSGNLAKIATELGFRVQIFCVGAHTQVIQSPIGTIRVLGSWVFRFGPFKTIETAALVFLAPRLARAVAQKLPTNEKVIIWGVGQWTLVGALVKRFFKHTIALVGTYFGSNNHDFRTTFRAISIKDHGFIPKIEAILAGLTIIPAYTVLEKFTLSSLDRIITHYRSTERILMDTYGLTSSKFSRIPYSVDLFARHRPNHLQHLTSILQKLKRPLIVTITRHEGRKQVNHLLYAYKILNDRKIPYSAVIIGDGKLLAAHRRLAKRLNLTNVSLPGAFPGVRPIFKRATLFAFASTGEGSSALVILEAMKHGLPIVSTAVDGIPEDIEHKKSALLVPLNNPEALADAIEMLLTNPKLAKKLGRAAKERYQKRYNKARVSRSVSTLLASLGAL